MTISRSFFTCCALFFALLVSGCTEPYTMTILYADSDGLEVGDPVMYKDYAIGEVEKIELKTSDRGYGGQFYVTVAIDESYRDVLYHQMAFVVRGQERYSEAKEIVVRDMEVRRPRAIAREDLVIGTENDIDLGDLGRLVGDVLEEVERELARELPKVMDELERELPRVMDEVERELAQAMRELERELPDALEELERELPEIMEEIEQALHEELDEDELEELIEALEESSEDVGESLARELERLAARLKHKKD